MTFLVEKVRNQISTPIGYRIAGFRSSDLFISAYPRSGSTWLRTMLSVILWPNEQLTSSLYNEGIPAISIRNAPRIGALSNPRYIMTHGRWNPGIERAIYLVRDGRDALISLYHYMTTRRGINLDFENFFYWYMRRRYGMRWEEHVTSWLDSGQRQLGESLFVMNFESLKANTFLQMELLCQFAGIKVDSQTLERAISLASIENMRNIEHVESTKEIHGDASFYRGGQSGQWENYLKGESFDKFKDCTSQAMSLANYEW